MSPLQTFISIHPGWFAFICVVIAGVLLLAWLLYFGFSKQPSEEEKARVYPGDELLGGESNRLRGTLAVTVDAPPSAVWPYLAQLGQRRAGFYAFDWLERLFSVHMYNTFYVVDECQNVYVGEYIFYNQNGIGSEVKSYKKDGFIATVSDSRAPSAFQGSFALVPPFGLKYFAWSWSFILVPVEGNKTRFFTRCDAVFEPFSGLPLQLVKVFLGVPSFVMCKAMLLKIKELAEKNH
ncbi:MAG: hypothetical protein VB013_14725 [Anaerolineaceae bacterium]|nr:hypothetical protein [Anaerolineaceae bacterium]